MGRLLKQQIVGQDLPCRTYASLRDWLQISKRLHLARPGRGDDPVRRLIQLYYQPFIGTTRFQDKEMGDYCLQRL